MRRPPITAILTAGACALSLPAPAVAQTPAPQAAAPQTTPSSANAAGLRYLTWPGRSYRPAPVGAPAAVPVETAEIADAAPILAATPTRPAIIPHGGQPAPAQSQDIPQRQGLTPASAWLPPQAPAYQPHPPPTVEGPGAQPYLASMPAAPPIAVPWNRARAVVPAPAPSPMVAPPTPTGYFAEAAPPPMPVAPTALAPRSVRAPVLTPAAAPVPAVYAPAPPAVLAAEAPTASATVDGAPAEAPVADPMAPRRDAPIFRLQRPSPQPAPAQGAQTEAQPGPAAETSAYAPAARGGARYYSVHRQAGRQPDATPLPAPVYLDALPVDLTSMPASTDLAEPPAAPNLIRNANGRLQALPANEDPVLP